MCAALTVPIIKDGYRLYPGMPVNGHRHHPNVRHGANRPAGANNSTSSSAHHQRPSSKGRSGLIGTSPPDSVSAYSGSPPGVVNNGQQQHVRQVILQPRIRTSSDQSQMSARSSFDVAPTSGSLRPDLYRGRSAMSTSQLYMQQRRELAIQQTLKKQESARKQMLQQQQQGTTASSSSTKNTNRKSLSPIPPHPQLAQRSDSNGNESVATDYDAEDSLNYCYDHQQPGKSCGDQNNNKDSATNPLRKLLKRLGLGNTTNQQHQRSESTSLSEEHCIVVEQAVPALQCQFAKSTITARQ